MPLALTALIALFSALAALAVSGAHDAHAHVTRAADRPGISAKQLAFRNEMRRLWEDHVVWTRMAVIGLTSGSADTQATVDRLLANQDDIGDAIEPFYGAAAGDALAKLLRSHILVAADVIAAAKAGDQAALADAQRRWEANADEIAAFLSRANPRQWKEGEVRAMMHEHLRLTTNEVVARLRQDWTGDVAAYDAIHGQILHMADMLSTGIVAQFPRRFR